MPTPDRQFADRAACVSGPTFGAHFSAPFIVRPVATFLLAIAILLVGMVAYQALPVASLPQVQFPVIVVGARLPGADPETMASSVTSPLEREFSRVAGINEMTSVSSAGNTSITLQFDLDRNIDGAARDVQAVIAAARSELPANMPFNPFYRKINPSESPILILSLTSDTLTNAQLYDVSDSILAQKIAQVQGVGQTFTGGSSKPAVRIEVDPDQLTAKGLSLEDLRAAIESANVLHPTGFLDSPIPDEGRMTISTTDQLSSASSYSRLIVATDVGPVSNARASSALPATISPNVTGPLAFNRAATARSAATSTHAAVRLGDVARAVDSVEDIHTEGFFDAQPAILLVVYKAPGANVVAAVDNVLKIFPALQASIPPQIKLQVILDRTILIRASVKDVTLSLVLSVLLVVLVVFAFLREMRSTVIPSVAVPLSILGTFGAMYLCHFTLDNLSLMALTISTGFVVDDAIVVTENIARYLELGLSPLEAALEGSREIGFTVLSISVSLIAAFIPILLMGGIVGRIFREFAIVLSVAIAISLVVSLTTTPMLAARYLKPCTASPKGWLFRVGEGLLAQLSRSYERALRRVLRHQTITLAVVVLTFILNILLFVVIPKGFFPQQDTGRLVGQIRAQQDSSFADMKCKMKSMLTILREDPAVDHAAAFLGGGGPAGNALNQATIFVMLKPFADRQRTGDTPEVVLDRLRPRAAEIPGAQLYLQSSQEFAVGARSTVTQYQYTLTSASVQQLSTWAPRMMQVMEQLPEIKDIATDAQDQSLEAYLTIDRTTASRLGISALNVDATLNDAFAQRQISTIYRPLNQYHVVMEVDGATHGDTTDIGGTYVKSQSGAEVPLSAITHTEMQRVPLAVNHQSHLPATTLSFNLAKGVPLSRATAAIEDARLQIGMPSGIEGGFQGTAQAFKRSLSSEPLLILSALLTVYIVLGMLYESLIHPLTILSTLPSAGVGSLLALLIFHIDLSVISIIGIILLIGIVKKNAIMMIDFALSAERTQGKSPRDAIEEACRLRFRPIMMTTMAALLGAIPLALGGGIGSELRRPLGITIVGGLILSQCLTLFTTPGIYLFFDRLRIEIPLQVCRIWNLLKG